MRSLFFIFCSVVSFASCAHQRTYFMVPESKHIIVRHVKGNTQLTYYIPSIPNVVYVRTSNPDQGNSFEKITNFSHEILDPLFDFAVLRKPENRLPHDLMANLLRKKRNRCNWERLPDTSQISIAL